MAKPPDDELHTWQEIAAHLGVSLRTAQNYQGAGLPVRRARGVARGRVLASREELDRWKTERWQAPRLNEEELLQAPLEAGRTVALRDKATQRISARMRSGLILGALAAVTAIPALMVWARRPRVPAGYRVQISTLITLDGQGREVWRRQFPKPFKADAYGGGSNLITFADIDGNGQVATLVSYYPEDSATVGATLFCFSQSGEERWRFVPGQRVVTDNSGQSYLPPYYINSTQVIAGRDSGDLRIAVSSNHHLDFPAQIAILNNVGELVGEYWHPGHLRKMAHADLNHDGRQKLLLAGVNNSRHSAVLLVFDPKDVHGTADNVGDAKLGLRGFGRGTAEAMVFFPRTCVGLQNPYNRVATLKVTKDRIVVAVAEDVDENSLRSILYELDYRLKVTALARPTMEWVGAHRELEDRRKLDHALSPSEIEALTNAVEVRRR